MTGKHEVISNVSPHTVKKFELIEGYIRDWKEKLLQTSSCRNLVLIEAMSNSGEYKDTNGRKVLGTPVRADKLLRNEAASRYPDKNIHVIFNNIRKERIEHLRTIIP